MLFLLQQHRSLGGKRWISAAAVPLSNAEFDAILTECTKRIDGDIFWQQDMKGAFNPLVTAIY